MDKRTLLAASGVVLGIGLLGGAYTLHRKTTTLPNSWPTPPTSASVGPALEELGNKYPNLKKLAEDPKIGSILKEFAEAYSAGGVERAKSFARERGFMNGNDDITLTVLTENNETGELEASLTALKVQILHRGDNQLDVLLPWLVVEEEAKSGTPPETLIGKVSDLKNVRGILPMEQVEKNQNPFDPSRSVDGVKVSHADRWHSAGFKGAGVKVGILDPEISKAPQFLGKVIPANTPIYMGSCVSGGRSVDDEGLHGSAAAEIVYAMAPGAQLYMACSLGDDDAAIQWLVNQGVRIISYSAGGIYGPRNGTGRSQDRIDRLAKQGILWVNAAGNDGRTFHRGLLAGTLGWQSFVNGKTAMGFKTKTVDGSIKITLIWNEWKSSFVSDYDLYLFDASMNEIARSTNRNTVIRQPTESISANLRLGTQYYIGIRANQGARVANFVLNVHNANTIELLTPAGSLNQPADAKGALSVGAVSWNTSKIASYSSRGPTEDGRLKPEISAPTEVSSVVYRGSFAGTSAATPHVSGAAALVWSRFPNYSREQVIQFLLGRVRDLGAPGPDNDYGYGYLDMGDPALGIATVAPTATAPPRPGIPTQPTSTPPRPGTAAPTYPTALPFPTALPVPTIAPPSPSPKPISPEDDDSDLLQTFITILILAVIGGFVFVGGLIFLAIKLLRGSKPSPPRPPPQYWGSPQAPSPPFSPSPAPQPGGLWQPNPAPAPHPPPKFTPGDISIGPFSPGGTVVPTGHGWTATLIALSGSISGNQLQLRPGIISLGRSPGNQFILPDPKVSSRHAVIKTDENGCWIEDMNSRNGLYINGSRVQKHFLRPGDVITIGPFHLRFEVSLDHYLLMYRGRCGSEGAACYATAYYCICVRVG